ncbi:MAG: rhodanese-like domain-containing protein [Pseudomonadota bacterium]
MTAMFLVPFVLLGCKDAPQAGSENTVEQSQTAPQPITDPARFISAVEVLTKLESNEAQWVFDARSKHSYDELRIAGAMSFPYEQFDEADLAAVKGLEKDSPIVTYCGCPHFLAGLVADQIVAFGYTNVKVLHEGFFHWRDNSFPVEGLNAQATTLLKFAGTLHKEGEPLAYTNVFIRNQRNGQLEATRTDSSGNYETGFHVYSYRRIDQFELHVGRLDAQTQVTLINPIDS